MEDEYFDSDNDIELNDDIDKQLNQMEETIDNQIDILNVMKGNDEMFLNEDNDVLLCDMINTMLYNDYYHDKTKDINLSEIKRITNDIDKKENLKEINEILLMCISWIFNTTSVKVDELNKTNYDYKMTYENEKSNIDEKCSGDNFHMICNSNIMNSNAECYVYMFDVIKSIFKNETIKKEFDKYALTGDNEDNEDIIDFIYIIYLFIVKPLTSYKNIKKIMNAICIKICNLLLEYNYYQVYIKLFNSLNGFISTSKDTYKLGRKCIIINSSNFDVKVGNKTITYSLPLLILKSKENDDINLIIEKLEENGLNNLSIEN